MAANLIDIIVLALILFSAVWGAFKGFVSQIVSIAALVAGVWCAFTFSRYCTGWLAGFADLFPGGERTLHVIWFIIILAVVVVLGHFLGKGIEHIVKLSMLNWLNRLLGVVFAALKIIIILSVIVYLVNELNAAWHLIPDHVLSQSRCYRALSRIAVGLFPFLKGFFH